MAQLSVFAELSKLCNTEHAFVSICGSGGKTTLLIGLGQYFKSLGKSVLLTTTTKLRSPYVQDYKADFIYDSDSVLDHEAKGGQVVFYALENKESGKWTCPPLENLSVLKDHFDIVLNEADGSRCLPVKVHTQRDPVVPSFSSYTISVFGLWALGRRTTEVAFGEERDLLVDSSYVQYLVDDSEGMLKRSLENRRAIVFNGADVCADRSPVLNLVYPKDVSVMTASLKGDELYEKIR